MAARNKLGTILWSIILPCAAGVLLCAIATGYPNLHYFRFLRWAVSGLSAWMLYVTIRRRPWLPIGFVVTLLIFNPYLPVAMEAKPDVRIILELLAATWFAVAGLFAAGHTLRRG